MVDAPKEDVNMEFDLADEQQILEEIQGKTFLEGDRWLYQIQGGWQLSYRAVKMACRMFAERGEAIEVEFPADVKYDPKDPEYLWVQIKGARVKIDPKTGHRTVLDSAIGSKRKWVKEELKDKSVRPDKFFYEKAIAQAERNAKMSLLPQDFLKDFIAHLLKAQKKGGAPVTPPKTAQKAPPAAPPPQKAPAAAPSSQPPPAPGKPPVPPPAAPKAASEPQNTAKPPQEAVAPSGAPAQTSSGLSALHQQFWAVLKSITKSKDEAAGRQALKRLTGKEKVSELDEATLRALGGILRKVSKKEADIDLDPADKTRSIVVDGPTKEVLWPPAPPPAAAPAEAAAANPDAPPAGEEWLI